MPTRRRRVDAAPSDDLLAEKSKIVTINEAGPPPAWLFCVVACVFTLLLLVMVVLVGMLSSYYMTGTFTWEYTLQEVTALPMLSFLFPPRIFTAEELAQYDGSQPDLPLYLCVMGHVYDVSSGARFYGPNGSYHIFVGRDASRSFATGCFNPKEGSECLEAAKRGLEGLDEKELKEIAGWIDFYNNSKEYHLVGYFPTSPAASEEAKLYL